MRAWEFIETDPKIANISVASLDDTRKPRITLRYLNQLKRHRKWREAELAKNQPLLAAMYGDADEQAEAVKDEVERQEERHDIEMLKQEMELLKDQIAVQIDAAEIDAERKENIAQGAIRAIARKGKEQ